ncbi:MAG: bifunctional 4-hydroxy-2-oxoglutarate aldolase/2-dehydro-3-deoxy-phosphogluconate aldolase [Chitinophagaceae bacterium]|nr:MAG: bifunctional 4-hydroxy-2-oxoglutarate aldolase/2-dehydro-3-deoxy-phosphogluconate aldolase [Chitinophagaceae bacterium]
MRKKEQAEKALLEQKVLPLYYHDSAEVSIEILRALYAGGVRILEYTNRGESALENFELLRKIADKEMTDLQLGIGTIKTKKQAKKYIEAGADFVVCPSINEEVGEVVINEKLLWIPGCMTPTEIATAENAGAEIVKLFPGNLLGPSYITSIKDLFPNLRFVVTGGVEAEESNLKAWFKSGVVGVGMGSKLVTKEVLANKDYEGLKKATAAALHLARKASQDSE